MFYVKLAKVSFNEKPDIHSVNAAARGKELDSQDGRKYTGNVHHFVVPSLDEGVRKIRQELQLHLTPLLKLGLKFSDFDFIMAYEEINTDGSLWGDCFSRSGFLPLA